MSIKLTGLVAATHTPFHTDGQLNLTAVEKQAEHLQRNGISALFSLAAPPARAIL